MQVILDYYFLHQFELSQAVAVLCLSIKASPRVWSDLRSRSAISGSGVYSRHSRIFKDTVNTGMHSAFNLFGCLSI
jgi:hypothetical protein